MNVHFVVVVTLDFVAPHFVHVRFGWKFLGMRLPHAKLTSTAPARRCVVGWQNCRKLLKLQSSNPKKTKRH